ncbi:MAG: cytochrome c3 family protein [Thermodesulfobacteriota bacterium]
MKRVYLTAMAMFATVLFCGSALANLTGSAHDFKAAAWSGNKICDPCHVPHKADITEQNAPLWNHQLTTHSPYQVYSSATLTAPVGQPGGISKLCLSCHDGTVALDSFGGATGSTMLSPNDEGYIGTDLRGGHPISFTYDDALAANDGELYFPTTTSSGLGKTVAVDMLFAGKMECASCHDPHRSDESPDNSPMLKKTNISSALCLTCHNK